MCSLDAILAVVWHYWKPLVRLVERAPAEEESRALIGKVLLAFVPAAIVGFLFHHLIEEHLFRPVMVAASLIVVCVIIIFVERLALHFDVRDIGWRTPEAVTPVGIQGSPKGRVRGSGFR